MRFSLRFELRNPLPKETRGVVDDLSVYDNLVTNRPDLLRRFMETSVSNDESQLAVRLKFYLSLNEPDRELLKGFIEDAFCSAIRPNTIREYLEGFDDIELCIMLSDVVCMASSVRQAKSHITYHFNDTPFDKQMAKRWEDLAFIR